MESSGSMSLKKYATKAILSFTCMGLTIAVCSTTAAGYMWFSGDPAARKRIIQVYDRCNAESSPYRNPSVSHDDEDRVFLECFDRYLAPIEGLYFAVLVHGSPGTGYSWNYRTLIEGFQRAKVECRKNAREPCTLRAFAVNACIAYGYHNEYGHHGYGVGPTKEVARRRMLGQEGNDARSCGSGCEVKKVYCAG